MSEVVLTIAQTLRLFRFYTQWPIFNKFQFHQALKFSVTSIESIYCVTVMLGNCRKRLKTTATATSTRMRHTIMMSFQHELPAVG